MIIFREGSGKVMIAIQVKNLSVFYGKFQALKDVSMDIERQKITALIGPSGCGKTTFLRSLNRMNDLVDDARVIGQVIFDGQDIYQKKQTFSNCGGEWVWFFKGRTLFP